VKRNVKPFLLTHESPSASPKTLDSAKIYPEISFHLLEFPCFNQSARTISLVLPLLVTVTIPLSANLDMIL
jgi:hypothetical protein